MADSARKLHTLTRDQLGQLLYEHESYGKTLGPWEKVEAATRENFASRFDWLLEHYMIVDRGVFASWLVPQRVRACVRCGKTLSIEDRADACEICRRHGA